MAVQAAGYPIGATLGGMVAAWLLERYGWRSVFVFGALGSALAIPLVMWRLPESVDFLIDRQPRNALGKLNRLLRLMGHQPLGALPAATQHAAQTGGSTVAALFRGSLGMQTTLIWLAFFLLMFSFYFSLSWTPKLLVQAGLSAQQGVTGGVLLNLGGIVGCTFFGVMAIRMRLNWLVALSLLGAGLFTAGFGMSTGSLALAFSVAIVLGIFLFASMAGLYSVVPVVYPPAIRVTGMGWAIGIGRTGAILSPTVAGGLLDQGWTPISLYYVFALPLVAAALVTLMAVSSRQAAYSPAH